jgi:hypothetical protein
MGKFIDWWHARPAGFMLNAYKIISAIHAAVDGCRWKRLPRAALFLQYDGGLWAQQMFQFFSILFCNFLFSNFIYFEYYKLSLIIMFPRLKLVSCEFF